MTLTIELTDELEACLNAMAKREGLAPAEVVKKLVTDHLIPVPPEEEPDPTLALFAQWNEEDRSMTPAEIAEENQTWEEFKVNINAERDRAGARRVF